MGYLMLTILTEVSDELLSKSASELYPFLPGPCLIHLDGHIKQPLFVSVLLHGNEFSGWEVIRQILSNYKNQTLPRSLSILIGNIKAASAGKRKLDDQPDFNRVWDNTDSHEARLMQTVLQQMQKKNVFASIDIHNNTGFNPNYACINSLQPEFLHLARSFSRKIVYFIRPRGVQSLAFSNLCPAVTLECGQPGDQLGIEKAVHLVDKILNLPAHENGELPASDYDLFHTTAVIKIPDEFSISFDGSPADIQFLQGIEKHNFEEIEADTVLADINPNIQQPFHVIEESGKEIFSEVFQIADGKLLTNRLITPSMLTDNITIVRQDCLCYLMEPYQLAWGEKKAVDDEAHSWSS
jgi:hypothetical protein